MSSKSSKSSDLELIKDSYLEKIVPIQNLQQEIFDRGYKEKETHDQELGRLEKMLSSHIKLAKKKDKTKLPKEKECLDQ